MVWTEALNPAILVAALLAPAGSCALSLGALGEQFEVAEVGTSNMFMVEGSRLALTTASFLLASFSMTAVSAAAQQERERGLVTEMHGYRVLRLAVRRLAYA